MPIVLPSLVVLPVLREEFCNQKITDSLCAYLCEAKPELIIPLVKIESSDDAKTQRHYNQRKAAGAVIEFLRSIEISEEVPSSRLGMLDFIYELCCRIRASLNLEPIPMEGTSLAPTPKGPFPLLKISTLRNEKNLTQDMVLEMNAAIDCLYNSFPEAFYEAAEQMIRNLYSYEIDDNFRAAVHNSLSKSNSLLKAVDIMLNARDRLRLHISQT